MAAHKGCSQQLIFCVNTSGQGCPSGVGTGADTVQHLTSEMYSGIKSALSKFGTNTKLSGAVSTMAGNRGPGQAGGVGVCKPREGQQDQVQGPVPGSEQLQTELQEGGDSAPQLGSCETPP